MNNVSKFGFKKALALALSAGIVLSATATLLSVGNYSASAETMSSNQQDYSEVLEPQILDVPATASIASSSTTSFEYGDGTEDSPYEIADADDLLNIANYSTTMTSQALYFKLTDNIYLSDAGIEGSTVQYICKYFNGYLDGNGKTIYAADGYQLWLATYTVDEAHFENLIIQQTTGSFGLVVYSGYYVTSSDKNNSVSFTDITVMGSETTIEYDYNDSAFLCIGIGGINFTRCVNWANLNMKSYAGIFIGGYTNNAKVSFIGCENYGKVTGQYVGFFTGNVPSDYSKVNLTTDKSFSDFVSPYTYVYVSECGNYEEMTGTMTCTPFATNDSTTSSRNDDANAAVVANGAFDEGVSLVSGENILSNGVSASVSNKVVTFSSKGAIDETSVDYYSLRVSISIGMYDSNGESLGSGYIWIDTDFSNTITDVNSLYYTQIIGSTEYKKATGIAYDDISGKEEYEAYFDIAYKTVETETGYIIVVDSEDAVDKIALSIIGTVSVSIDKTPTYRLNAYDSSSTVIGSAICDF